MRIWHQSFSDLDRAPVYRATLARHAATVMAQGDSVVLHGAMVMDSLGVLFRYAAFLAGARSALGMQVSRVGHYARAPAAMLEQARAAAGAKAMDEPEFSGDGTAARGRLRQVVAAITDTD